MTIVLRDIELSVRENGYIVIPRECIGKIILENVDIHYSCVEDELALRQANADYINICIKPNVQYSFKQFRMAMAPGEWNLYEMLERMDITHITLCYTDNTRVTYTVAWNEETGDFEGEKRVDILEDEVIQLRVAKIGLNSSERQTGIFILQKGFRKGYIEQTVKND